MTDRTPIPCAAHWILTFGVFTTAPSCGGPDFSTRVQDQPDAGAGDVLAEVQTVVICTDCQDLTSTMDASNDGATGADSMGSAAVDAAVGEGAVGQDRTITAQEEGGANEGGSGASGLDTNGSAGCDASTATLCGTACVDTSGDSRNCGSCGHSCLGGACSSGQCQPVLLASSDALSKYSSIAVSGGGVFWTVEGSSNVGGALYASPLPTASSMYPLSSKMLASGLDIDQIAVDALNVYWGDPYAKQPAEGGFMLTPALVKIPVGGGYPPATIVSGGDVGFPTGVALDSANLYVANERNILQVPLSGSTTTAIASTNQAYVIASDSSNLYWTDFGASTIVMLAKGGTQPVTLATGQPIATFYGGSSLTVDSANVYWLGSDGSVRAASKSSGATPPVRSLVTSGAAGVAADGVNVYWTSVGAGAIMRMGTNGGAPATVAPNQNPLGAITVDSNAVYWTDAAGVMAIAK